MKIIVMLTIACAIATPVASAQPPSAETLYELGQTSFDRGDYSAAIVAWSQSYNLSHQALLLFNIAQAHRLAGRCDRALAIYREFIANDPTADQRPLADDLVRELDLKCGAPIPTPMPIAGRQEARHDLKFAGLVTGGTGVALLVTGLGLGHHAQTIGDEVTAACAHGCDWTAQKDKDASGRRDASIGYALDAVGVAAIAGGAILYYLGDRQDEIHVAPTARGAVLSWGRSW